MPGEFEPQDGVILIWPKRPGSWPYEAKEAGKVFAEIANKLAEADSAHASQYEANAEAYCGRIQVLCNRARALREQIQGEPVVIFHEAYAT